MLFDISLDFSCSLVEVHSKLVLGTNLLLLGMQDASKIFSTPCFTEMEEMPFLFKASKKEALLQQKLMWLQESMLQIMGWRINIRQVQIFSLRAMHEKPHITEK